MSVHSPTAAALPRLRIAIIGGGPAGLALALLAAELLDDAAITVYDARPADLDLRRDGRTLALSLGSLHLLERLGVWPLEQTMPIRRVHVSQAGASSPGGLGQAAVQISADEQGVAQLGAVTGYGTLTAALQQRAEERSERGAVGGSTLLLRWGTPVAALKDVGASSGAAVEVDAGGIVETFDLVVVAEGGVFQDQARKALTHDYRQTAWVGRVDLAGAPPGTAFERFTSTGPVALLPLPNETAGAASTGMGSSSVPGASASASGGTGSGSVPGPSVKGGAGSGFERGTCPAALVWCVAGDDSQLAAMDDASRREALQALLPAAAGRLVSVGPLKRFPLGLNAEATLVQGRRIRIGNAAQTLHPVAGQGLNLGLRDAQALVRALRGCDAGPSLDAALRAVEWQRGPDRWALIATTDFLARSFTWRLPGASLVRAAGLAGLHLAGPIKRQLARRMMFGWR